MNLGTEPVHLSGLRPAGRRCQAAVETLDIASDVMQVDQMTFALIAKAAMLEL
jgi:hypothetical protein